ncbi:MAG: CPBP family intramembrane metalloprotease [Candidatus Kerfeldbacteria bacterium]|nr:CPBP family intramembrane metalloprotease [Candidatus Kerfeldbacteria bacterium]
MKKSAPVVIVLVLLPFVIFEWIPDLNRWLLSLGIPTAIGELATSGPVLLVLTALAVGLAWVLVRIPRAVERPTGQWRIALSGFGLLFLPALIGRLVDPSFDEVYARTAGLQTLDGLWIFLLGLPFWLLREELFLRFSQRWLTSCLGAAWTIMTVSALFSILHYPAGFSDHAWSVLPGVFLGSIILAAVYERTKSLWRTFAVHLVYDAVIALQIMLHASGGALGETVLWSVYGIVFLLTARRGWRELRAAFHMEQRTRPLAVAAASALAVVIPLLIEFVF